MFHVKHQLKIFRLNYIPISPNNHSDISKINIPILVVYRFSSKNSVTNGILTNPLNRFTAEKATEIQKIAKTAPRTIPNSLSANFRILIFEIALFKSFFKKENDYIQDYKQRDKTNYVVHASRQLLRQGFRQNRAVCKVFGKGSHQKAEYF